jgi:hypothetical protein
MTFILSPVFVFPLLSLASFLAVGPPAAPPLEDIGSANQFREAEIDAVWRNLKLPSNLGWNQSVQAESLLHSNQTFNSDGTTAAGGYYWLADKKYQHRVSVTASCISQFITVIIDATCWKWIQSVSQCP